MSKRLLRTARDNPVVLALAIRALRLMRSMGFLRSRRVYSHVPYRGTVTVDCGAGRHFRIRSRGHNIENGLYWDGLLAHEPASMRAWIGHAEKADVVLDIGANSGVFALAAAAVGAKAVHGFEPLPRVHAIFADNAALNPGLPITTWPVAVGAEDGTATIFDPGGEAPTSASLSQEFVNKKFGELPAVSIQVRSIDAFWREQGLGRVDLVKIDVEGYEEHALRGMRDTVAACWPAIMMEVLPGQERALRRVVEELWPGRYDWKDIDEGPAHVSRNVWLSARSGDGRLA